MILLEAAGILVLIGVLLIPLLVAWERSISKWNKAEQAAWREEHR